MLKFPKIEGPMAQAIRAELLTQVPPSALAKGDADRAFQAAVDAVNAAFETAAASLERLSGDGQSDMVTRSMAMIMFMQLMEAQVGAAKDAVHRVLARLAVEQLFATTILRAEAARSTSH